MKASQHLRLAAMNSDVDTEHDVLEDYVAEVALLHELPMPEARARFRRFLDVYHYGTATPTDAERAALASGDVEHSFIRISKPFRFRHADTVPTTIDAIRDHLATGTDRPRVLEFGGGGGTDAIVYARTGFEVHYADLTALKATDVVRRRFELRGLDILIWDSVALPSRTYDVITAMDVIEHIYDVEAVTAELLGRIPRGGLLCCANAFGDVTHDGDHLDKNRVYVELFPVLMEAAGFRRIEYRPPLEVYRREADVRGGVNEEVTRLKTLLYATTRDRARQRVAELLPAAASASELDWARLPVSGGGARSNGSVKRRFTQAVRRVAARTAPQPVRRTVRRMRAARVEHELRNTSDAVEALGSLSDWTAVLRIAEHRLAGDPGSPPTGPRGEA